MKHNIWRTRVVAAALVAGVAVVGGISEASAKTKKTDAVKKEAALKGYLGIYMQELTPEIRKGMEISAEKGVLVSGVEDDSPADKSGIKEGDVIVSFGGSAVASPDEMRNLVGKAKPGATVSLQIAGRDGNRTVDLIVGERPDGFAWNNRFEFEGPDWEHFSEQLGEGRHHIAAFFGGPRLGVETAELSSDLAPYFDAKPGVGVLITSVDDESVAQKAGVKAGDIITGVNDTAVKSAEELRRSLHDIEDGNEFVIAVQRKGKKSSLKATMDIPDRPFVVSRRPGMDRRSRIVIRDHDGGHGEDDNEDLHREMDELRKELNELKKQMKKDG